MLSEMQRGAGFFLAVLVALAMAVMVSGCAEKPQIRMVYASGSVKIKGAPAENVMVQCMPDGIDGPTSSGITDQDGRFVLKTDDGLEQAVVGKCKITLVDMNEGRAAQGEAAPPPRISAQYTIAGPRGLSDEVRDDGKSIEIVISD